MLCSKPYHIGSVEVRCGQCMPCRIYRRQVWTARCTLEMCQFPVNSFVTLTYADEYLPKDGSLSPRDVKLFLMRMRKSLDQRFRYFLVGEYGPKTWRPHYHMLLFGLSPALGDVQKWWSMGYTDVRPASLQNAQYAAQYTTKKMTAPDDVRLDGRFPEFMRCSLKPGIGANALGPMVAWYRSAVGCKYLAENHNVISAVRIGGKLWPLGRYLTNRLRVALDMPVSTEQRMFEIVEELKASRAEVPDYEMLRAQQRVTHKERALGKLRQTSIRRVL